MKKYFYIGLVGIILFEIANVYFIMPMPGSQQMNSVQLAYFLFSKRWLFRLLLIAFILTGLKSAYSHTKLLSKILTSVLLIAALAVIYLTNFVMAADSMFLQVRTLSLKNRQQSSVAANKLILGIEYKGIAKAYPIQYLGYHHQVFDTIANKPVMVTYCTVCRTGRVYEPVVKGKVEKFRLVGMDHFNAMFEDRSTKSWWRQSTGEAVAGELAGQILPEYKSCQMELRHWLMLYPNSLIMQGDNFFNAEYQAMFNYENGNRSGKLTRRDTSSWLEKSWVVGVTLGKASKAYDWNQLVKERLIHDEIKSIPIVVIMGSDDKTFVAFRRNSKKQAFQIINDTIFETNNRFNLLGKSLVAGAKNLEQINCYQEYWHSWKNFHPQTQKY